MKALVLSGWMMAITMQAAAQSAAPVQEQAPSTAKRTIVVSLEDRKLALVEDGEVKKVYTVAVGKPSTPSPEGNFTIERRAKNPTYEHDGKRIPPGPGNPVGTRWIGLSVKGYGIHGTNEPRSIGKAASHGCIRMAQADLEEFYELVGVGDAVEIVGHRNEETARLFGTTPQMTPAEATILLAQNPAEQTELPADGSMVVVADEETPAASHR